jgi:hypothetical protein
MIRITLIHSDTNGNSHIFKSFLCVIMSLLMPIVIEKLLDVRFASQRENDY